MHGGQKSGRARLEQRLPAPGVPWEGGIAFRVPLTTIPTVPVQLDLTAPVKIYIIIIVQIHGNEHEFSCVKSLWARYAIARARRRRMGRCADARRGIQATFGYYY